jgi:hypothetical protein
MPTVAASAQTPPPKIVPKVPMVFKAHHNNSSRRGPKKMSADLGRTPTVAVRDLHEFAEMKAAWLNQREPEIAVDVVTDGELGNCL